MFPLLKQHRYGLSLVVIAWLIFFSPILSGQSAYFLDDLKIIYHPMEVLYAQFQHDWQLPVWSNEFGFGHPLLAWGQLGFFTPLHLALRALYVPPVILLQISVAAYFLFGSVGMYAFLAHKRLHHAAAALGAITFAYCGFNIGHLNHVNFYTGTMLLPWLLIAIDSIIQHPNTRRATTLAIVAAIIPMSAQPQVALYVFVAATVVGFALLLQRFSTKAVLATVYAGIVAFLLSSFSFFPLQEFLPETDRAAGLPILELYEFSYPPFHTITLIAPYFFGGHDTYFGPKGFQELAAYTGIIPLILAGAALASWKTYRNERLAALVLAIAGAILALGEYSPVYTYLVENHYISTIGVVGRFVFFFDIGIILLAAIGLHDLLAMPDRKKAIVRIAQGILLPVILIALPVTFSIQRNPGFAEQFWESFSINALSWLLVLCGIFATAALPLMRPFSNKRAWILPILAAGTLLVYGWEYNPRVPMREALNPSPFAETLREWRKEHGIPARLYAAQELKVSGDAHLAYSLSDPISPHFSVMQPIAAPAKRLACIIVPIQADSEKNSTLSVEIREGLTGPVYYQKKVQAKDVFRNTEQEFCLPETISEKTEGMKNLIIAITSDEETNMKVFTHQSTNEAEYVYFVRKEHASEKQIAASRKPLAMRYSSKFAGTQDSERALMVRHIQATAGASGARWIGALSIRPYREFVDIFFANDSEPLDGDNTHAIARNKTLVDMAGITHFTQLLPYDKATDPMVDAGYILKKEEDIGSSRIRLYENPTAYPKVFFSETAKFIAADDETRTQLLSPSYDPRKILYVSGPKPPVIAETDPSVSLNASAEILSYTETRVDIKVKTNKEAFLVLNDATTPAWHTFIDNEPALQLRANTIFKAAQVPAGEHVVSFQYSSPAIKTSKLLTGMGTILAIAGYAIRPTKR